MMKAQILIFMPLSVSIEPHMIKHTPKSYKEFF